MLIDRIKKSLRLIGPYIAPTIAIALWTRLSFEGGYQAGWIAFQNANSLMADGRPSEYVAVQILVAVSFVLAAVGRRLAAFCLASALCVLAGITWVGWIA